MILASGNDHHAFRPGLLADRSDRMWISLLLALLAASTGHLDIPHNPREREDLYNVFDSMDFDGNPWQQTLRFMWTKGTWGPQQDTPQMQQEPCKLKLEELDLDNKL